MVREVMREPVILSAETPDNTPPCRQRNPFPTRKETEHMFTVHTSLIILQRKGQHHSSSTTEVGSAEKHLGVCFLILNRIFMSHQSHPI